MRRTDPVQARSEETSPGFAPRVAAADRNVRFDTTSCEFIMLLRIEISTPGPICTLPAPHISWCRLANFARAVRGSSYLPRTYHLVIRASSHPAFDVFGIRMPCVLRLRGQPRGTGTASESFAVETGG